MSDPNRTERHGKGTDNNNENDKEQIEWQSGFNVKIDTEDVPVFVDNRNLRRVILGPTTRSIPNNAFFGCTNLEEVIFLEPSRVARIGDGAFTNCCALKKIKLPESILSIGTDAFLGCSSLATIILPKGIVEIQGRSFNGCTSLLRVEVPEGVRSLGPSAFSFCRSLKSIRLPNSLFEIPSDCFHGCKSLADVNIPDSVRSIGTNAFAFCSSLPSVVLPRSLEQSGYSFYGCKSLVHLELPDNTSSFSVEKKTFTLFGRFLSLKKLAIRQSKSCGSTQQLCKSVFRTCGPSLSEIRVYPWIWPQVFSAMENPSQTFYFLRKYNDQIIGFRKAET